MLARVFVSSTYSDLKAHRARALEQLRVAGFHVDAMEDWPADSTEPTAFCPERIRDCQLCILMVSFRRGWVPDPSGANRSITQMEYAEAIKQGVDVLPLFLADDVREWPLEYDERADAQVQSWRDTIRSQAGNEKFHFNHDPASVDLPLAAALSRWRHRQEERGRLADYLKCVRDAHKKINFLGLPTFQENPDVRIDDLFVEPALATQFADPDRGPRDWAGLTSLFDTVAREQQLVILGDPGTGKSTIVNWLVYQLSREGRNPWKARLGDLLPLPLVLRDLGIGRGITWDALLDKFLAGPAHNLLKRDHLLKLLEAGSAMFFLDGLDELGDVKTREDLRDAVHDGLTRYPACRWLLTSRIVGYDEVPFHLQPATQAGGTGKWPAADRWRDILQAMDVRYAAPFDDPRIEEFADKWYRNREQDPYRVSRGARDLVEAVRRDPDTLRLGRIPNLLTMMALVHRVKAALPHGKALLYEYVAEAYLETIDAYKKLRRDADSLRDKKRWLGRVAFEMQLRRAAGRNDRNQASAVQGAGRTNPITAPPPESSNLGHSGRTDREQANAIVVDGDTLRGWLAAAMAESGHTPDPDDPERFLERVRKRSGLIIERSADRFAFTHLSFQEYFAGVYLQEWVTSAEWLTGEEVPPGTSPEDLRRYGNQPAWQIALVFLFELIADGRPLGKKKVRQAVFGPNWELVACTPRERAPAAVLLLTRLAIDPHVNWEAAAQAAARERCLDWIVMLQQRGWTVSGSEVLRVFLSGERETVPERLKSLAERWAKEKVHFLDLSGTGVADLRPLSELTALEVLSLERTRATDLTPLSRLTGLQLLYLDGTGISNLAPLARFKSLQVLSLERTVVSDLGPLSGLTDLQVLSLERTPVADLSPLSRLTGLKILFLDGTHVSNLAPLSGLKGLRELRLEGTRVSDLSPLSGLTGLQVLSLGGTDVPEVEVIWLRARLPELHILR